MRGLFARLSARAGGLAGAPGSVLRPRLPSPFEDDSAHLQPLSFEVAGDGAAGRTAGLPPAGQHPPGLRGDAPPVAVDSLDATVPAPVFGRAAILPEGPAPAAPEVIEPVTTTVVVERVTPPVVVARAHERGVELPAPVEVPAPRAAEVEVRVIDHERVAPHVVAPLTARPARRPNDTRAPAAPGRPVPGRAEAAVLPPPPPRAAAPAVAPLAPLPGRTGWRDSPVGGAASEPVVHVTIGRVEVKADGSAQQAAPVRREPAVSTLDAYLARRAQERAGR